MKKIVTITLFLAAATAGCSQTTSPTAQSKTSAVSAPGKQPSPATQAQRCGEAARKAAQASQNAAIAGTLLSAVGSFGGLGGQGGAIAGQAASLGGSVLQQQAQNNAQNAMMDECS